MMVLLSLQASAQSQQQKEQLERLPKDVGSIALVSGTATDNLSPVQDPSDLTPTRGTLDEEDEEADSDADLLTRELQRKATKTTVPEFYAGVNDTVLEEK